MTLKRYEVRMRVLCSDLVTYEEVKRLEYADNPMDAMWFAVMNPDDRARGVEAVRHPHRAAAGGRRGRVAGDRGGHPARHGEDHREPELRPEVARLITQLEKEGCDCDLLSGWHCHIHLIAARLCNELNRGNDMIVGKRMEFSLWQVRQMIQSYLNEHELKLPCELESIEVERGPRSVGGDGGQSIVVTVKETDSVLDTSPSLRYNLVKLGVVLDHRELTSYTPSSVGRGTELPFLTGR